MARQTTTYEVAVVYNIKGNGHKAVHGIGTSARRATQDLWSLQRAMATVGVGFGMAKAAKAFVGFNVEVDRMKIGLSTVLSMNLSLPFGKAREEADRLFTVFQKMAIQSPGTTKEYIDMANQISSAVTKSGLGIKGLEDITHGAMIASAALGAKRDMFALDVTQMLNGQLTVRDRFARQMLHAIGESDHTAFNQYSAQKRAALTQKALTNPVLGDAAKAYETSFEGATSTLKDNIEIAFGKAGLPLTKAITKEVLSWNKWIQANPKKIEEITTRMGEGLKSAFYVVKDIAIAIGPMLKDLFGVIQGVLGFMANHKDTLVGLVKAMLIYKGVGMAFGMAKGIGGFFGGAAGGIKNAFSASKGGIAENIGKFSSALPGAIDGIAKLAAAAYILGDLLLGETEKEKKSRIKVEGQIKDASEFKAKREELNKAQTEWNRLYGDTTAVKTGDTGGLGIVIEQLRAEMDDYSKRMKTKLIEDGFLKETIAPNKARVLTAGVFNAGIDTDGNTIAGTPKGALGRSYLPMLSPEKRKALASMSEAAQLILEYESAKHDKSGLFGAVNTLVTDVLRQSFSNVNPRLQNLADTNTLMAGWKNQSLPGTVFGSWVESLNADGDKDKDGPKPPGKPEVNVNIHKIEVYSDDPDRFVAQAVQSFEDVVRNPTQAGSIFRTAF